MTRKPAATAAEPDNDAPEATPPPPKKVLHRKPIWVLVRVPADADGVAPDLYTVHCCNTKREVESALAAHKIDVSTANDRVILLRSDSLPLNLSAQLIIKY